MMLKSFGCSFIFGSELHDDGHGTTYATPSQFTWPALLAKDLNYTYSCYARPGSGNLQILERVLTHVACNQPALFVIGWTWIDRFDYINCVNDRWQTILPGDNTEYAEYYYKNFHSQYRDKFITLTAIKIAIDTLKQKKCPFIMTYMDELIFETKWHNTPAITDLQDYIRPYMVNFEGADFLTWSKNNNFPIGQRGEHPLEQAHHAAFELIKSYNLV